MSTRIRRTQTQLKDGDIVLKLNSKNLSTIYFPDLTDPQLGIDKIPINLCGLDLYWHSNSCIPSH
jgi:hypothetical protein